MQTLKRLYYDLTGTHYIKAWFVANGVVVKVKSYGMEEIIQNEFGKFSKPVITESFLHKDKFFVIYDINNYQQKKKDNEEIKPLKLVEVTMTPLEVQALSERESLLNVKKPDKKPGDFLNQQTAIMLIVGLAGLYVVYKLLTTGSVF